MTNIFVRFLKSEQGATFNLFFAHLLFWALGFPTVIEYGYANGEKGDDGQIPSGTKGSGVFPMTLVLVLISTFIWGLKLFRFMKDPPPEIDLATQIATMTDLPEEDEEKED